MGAAGLGRGPAEVWWVRSCGRRLRAKTERAEAGLPRPSAALLAVAAAAWAEP
eukprot:COSAG04_NODE_9695_length_839_cov_2.916216_1_plen_52_part_10